MGEEKVSLIGIYFWKMNASTTSKKNFSKQERQKQLPKHEIRAHCLRQKPALILDLICLF